VGGKEGRGRGKGERGGREGGARRERGREEGGGREEGAGREAGSKEGGGRVKGGNIGPRLKIETIICTCSHPKAT